jgi:hypothetical protein
MKKAHIFRFILFGLILLLPLSRLNTEVKVISTIDNKYLTEFPNIVQGYSSFMNQLNDYLTDRLGGRGRLIQLNGVLNDKLFNYLEHSLYEYGKDNYVFFKVERFEEDFDFLDLFTNHLLKIQDYCSERDVPFVYILNPAKWSVYTDYLPKGYLYQNDRLNYFQELLKTKGINHVDATEGLVALVKTEQVFNRKYDAGHWNARGAFYSVNMLLEKMNEYEVSILPNKLEDYRVDEVLEKYYPVSNILVNEYVPKFSQVESNWEYVGTDFSDELIISNQFKTLIRTISAVENDVRLLMFQGSGFNGQGHRFIASAVKSYQSIHNYQNLIDFDYYFNLFKPTFVVVNSAEYATTEGYFSKIRLEEKQFNPILDVTSFIDSNKKIEPSKITNGTYLTTIWFDIDDIRYGYLADNKNVYDLIHSEENDWCFSAFQSAIDIENSVLYLVMDNGEKISFKLSIPELEF